MIDNLPLEKGDYDIETEDRSLIFKENSEECQAKKQISLKNLVQNTLHVLYKLFASCHLFCIIGANVFLTAPHESGYFPLDQSFRRPQIFG